ncbi:MAG TPA: DUF2652 domain-containing protein [Candidatus Limnocylindrales bacterium]|nr:DUF2652 domain-containing protein [Candidatus Limnocylindrales bacterium]
MLGSNPEPACLLIADISGYTGFLAGAELDHAQDILADVMATVVGSLRPTFRLAKLEGDAAFAYVATERVDAAILQDTVERCYFAFRRRLRDVNQASTCDCNACVLVPSLDLKIVAHHGRIVRQRIAGREELLGSDVIVVHRLLKNHVEQATGARAYALYTAACAAAMGLDDPAGAGLVEHREEFEGVGEIVGWIRDLEAAWQDELDRVRVVVERKDAVRTYTASFAAPPSVVWEYVTSPIRRPKWQQGVSAVVEQPGQPGRRGVGTVNHCMHGKDAIVEEVLDWRPYDYVTYRAQLPQPGTPPLVDTYLLEDDGAGGTRVEMRFGKPRSARQRAIMEAMLPSLDEMMNGALAALRPAIDAEMASRRAEAAEAPAEPALAASAGRNLTEPIARTA